MSDVSPSSTFRVNNFDLLRLFAAMQVVIHHAFKNLEIRSEFSEMSYVLTLFPGVPVFFFVSGFLLSKSYERNSVIKEYGLNRAFRIFPALIVCTLVAVGSVFLTGYEPIREVSVVKLLAWMGCQMSVLQFYNPGFMREFGNGVLNGSLWTISVELQFYVMMPILYWVMGLGKTKKRNGLLLAVILGFMVVNIACISLLGRQGDETWHKLWVVSFTPWIYMFLIGALFQRNFERVYALLSGRFLPLLFVYIGISVVTTRYMGWEKGNSINPILYVILACVIFSAAYSMPWLGRKLLRGNDISYGVYIYHIPIINLLLYYGHAGKPVTLAVVISWTIIVATLSWLLVEKPCLKLKKRPLNPITENS